MNKGGFDIIIGNPPYVKEDKNRLIFHHAKASAIKKYYAKYMDYWYFFIKALDHLKENGLHSFYRSIINWIWGEFSMYIDSFVCKTFQA